MMAGKTQAVSGPYPMARIKSRSARKLNANAYSNRCDSCHGPAKVGG
jgi:hypothetical protein